MNSETKPRKKYSKSKPSKRVKENGSFNVVQLNGSKQKPHEKVLAVLLTMLKIATKILAVVLPLLFIFIGSLKLYPIIPAVFYAMQVKFIKYANEGPTAMVGFVIDPHTYRIFIGVWEVCAGLGALLCPLDVKRLSSFALTVIMCWAVVTHVLMQDFAEIVPPFVFGSLWLYLYFHYNRKMKQDKVN